MNTETPTRVTYSTPTGPEVGLIVHTRLTGYLVQTAGRYVFVDFGLVHYSN